MRRIRQSEFKTAAWKNGGGVTHEIARHDDGDVLVWRISLAEVAADGPFSQFAGLTRVLTVIEGAGVDLHSANGILAALPLVPVRFSGGTPIDGRLRDGPCRDVNLIFDATRIAASASVLRPGGAGNATALLALAGDVRVGGMPLAPGDFAWTDRNTVRTGADGLALMIELAPAISTE